MRPGATEEQVLDGRPVPGPSEHRPHREELIERHFAVEDVPLEQKN
jgi:hypothetical protein